MLCPDAVSVKNLEVESDNAEFIMEGLASAVIYIPIVSGLCVMMEE